MSLFVISDYVVIELLIDLKEIRLYFCCITEQSQACFGISYHVVIEVLDWIRIATTIPVEF